MKDTFGTAAILAGGKSERMLGLDKQVAAVGGIRLVDDQIRRLSVHFDEIIVVTFRPELYAGSGVRTVADRIPGFGPLSGLHAALAAAHCGWVFLMACDMPGFDPRLMEYFRNLLDNDLQEPTGKGPEPEFGGDDPVLACVSAFREHIEPFHAFYSKGLIPRIESLCSASPVARRRASIGSLLSSVNRILVPESDTRKFTPDWNLYRNINTPEDLESYAGEGRSRV